MATLMVAKAPAPSPSRDQVEGSSKTQTARSPWCRSACSVLPELLCTMATSSACTFASRSAHPFTRSIQPARPRRFLACSASRGFLQQHQGGVAGPRPSMLLPRVLLRKAAVASTAAEEVQVEETQPEVDNRIPVTVRRWPGALGVSGDDVP